MCLTKKLRHFWEPLNKTIHLVTGKQESKMLNIFRHSSWKLNFLLAYANCANDVLCAASSVQGYMRKFGQDCNDDGIVSWWFFKILEIFQIYLSFFFQINCFDYSKIHKFGGYNCKTQLPFEYASKFDTCINYALQQQG